MVLSAQDATYLMKALVVEREGGQPEEVAVESNKMSIGPLLETLFPVDASSMY